MYDTYLTLTKEETNSALRKAKKYLSNVYALKLEIETKTKQIEQLSYISYNLSSYDTTKIRVDASAKYSDETLVMAIQLKDRLNERIRLLYSIYDETDAKISALSEPLEANVLRLKYLLFKTSAQIAEELNYSERHITRILNKALINFAKLYYNYNA